MNLLWEKQMKSLDEAIRSLDTEIFAAIPSETTENDRRSILVLQNCVRGDGAYAYLEVGSFIGGTIQPFYADDRCQSIYSIDNRPDFVPDERGRQWYHYDQQVNSTAMMLANLAKAFPTASAAKIHTFDSDAGDVDKGRITNPPALCFIDAEHTNTAVFDDFTFCRDVSRPDAIIAFHDAGIVFGGIRKIKRFLEERAVHFRGCKLGGSVYAILLNDAVEKHSAELAENSMDEESYFREAEQGLSKAREEYGRFSARKIKQGLVRFPFLFRPLRAVKRFFIRPTKRQI